MQARLLTLVALLTLADLQGRTVVANYRSDFTESGSPSMGWSYLWNAPPDWEPGNPGDQVGGFIGVPHGYRGLKRTDTGWTADGDTIGGNNVPSGFLRLSSTGGHPGPSAGSSNNRARYAIAAYTVPTSGLYAIENSFISPTSPSGDGVEVLVFPGKSEAVLKILATPEVTTSFNVEIGHLDAGQTIYVAIGPGEGSVSDAFSMDFDIVHYERLSLKTQLLNGINSRADVVTLIPGRYFVNPASTYVSIGNYNPSNPVTVIADGVELILQSNHRAISFIRCSNLHLQGLSIDYDPLLFRQGTVENITNNVFRVRLHEGYPTTLSSAATSGIIYDQSNLWMKQMTSTFYPTAVSQLEPGLYAVTTSSRLANLTVGNHVTLTEPNGIPHAFYMENCSAMRIEGLRIHGSPSFALLSRNGYQIELENVSVIPGHKPLRASLPRLLSSNADGLHFKHSRGEISINNCHTAYNGDDCIILTNSYAPIIAKDQGNVLTISNKAPQDKIIPGDELYIYNPLDGKRQSATVVSVVPVSMREEDIRASIATLFPNARLTSSTFEYAYTITLDRAVSAPVGGWVANRSGESNGFVISNCTINNTRARGILVKASDGVVRNNDVFNAFLAGIQLRPEADLWMEGDYAQNVLIENNDLRRCAIGLSNAYAPIYISAEGAPNWSPGYGHVNLTIARNRIYNAPSASIYVKYADNVLIRSNRFVTSHNFTNANPFYPSAIRIEHANQVRLDGVNLAVGLNHANANRSALLGLGPDVSNLQVLADILIDDDKDLLPDTWEIERFGNVSTAKGSDDFDNDGLPMVDEFMALLDPLLPDAFLAHIEPTSPFRISWTPTPNRFITVLSTPSLDTPFSILDKDIPAELGSYAVPLPTESRARFFRIQITD